MEITDDFFKAIETYSEGGPLAVSQNTIAAMHNHPKLIEMGIDGNFQMLSNECNYSDQDILNLLDKLAKQYGGGVCQK